MIVILQVTNISPLKVAGKMIFPVGYVIVPPRGLWSIKCNRRGLGVGHLGGISDKRLGNDVSWIFFCTDDEEKARSYV